ncbi:neutral/alkaline non-lysosomal ceramidase N-terminal domain-containing protein, partial [bacterium]|nr:neutral/alkaline non-lysosomal ceramidase N-terminal domain-containing protein [bacterium]
MKRRIMCAAVAAVVLFSWVFMSSADNPVLYAASKKSISAGVAKIKTTPETPIPMSGYGGRKDAFKGIHDDLFARTIVFSDGENTAALIAVDISGFSHDLWDEISTEINEKTGIPKENIILSATHTHDGPTTRGYKEVSGRGYNQTYSADVAAYVKALKQNLVSVVTEAKGNLAPVRIGAGEGECLMNINRRAEDGKGNITLGRNPYGPCDHDVAVVRIDNLKGDPAAVFVNWPCHGVVMGPRNYLISGDWPGAAARYVEKNLGSNVIVPVTAGASGDVNPIYGPHMDFESSYAYAVDAIGKILGEEVIRVAEEIETSSTGSVSCSQRFITLPGKKRSASNIQKGGWEPGPDFKIRLSVLKVGNVVFTGVSGEVFTQIGMQVKELSPYKNTCMISHCNGSSGYLVTDDAYPKGGYEVRSTRALVGTEKAIIVNLVDMIKKSN